jgi:RHS repeat-associated protein
MIRLIGLSVGRSVSGVTKFFNYAGFETDPTSDGASSWSRSPGGSVLGQTRAGASVLVGTERHGDVAWTLNPTTGTIADSTVSDPYGKVLSVTGTPGQVGFQGDWTDPLTGLVWMAARWYDTQTGTFTSRDTYPGSVGAALTLNRYSYGLNSPLAFSDPTGHSSEHAGCYGADGSYDWSCDAAANASGGDDSEQRAVDVKTNFSVASDGSVVVTNTSSGVQGVLAADGSSQQVTSTSTTYSSPNPVSTAIDGTTHAGDQAFTATGADGSTQSCTAGTAGGYGRTCLLTGADGSYGVVGPGGFAVVDSGGTLHESGPIDRNNYVDESEGSRNVTRAAVALLLPNANYADLALKFDRWCVFGTHGGSGGGCRGGSIQTGVKDAAGVAVDAAARVARKAVEELGDLAPLMNNAFMNGAKGILIRTGGLAIICAKTSAMLAVATAETGVGGVGFSAAGAVCVTIAGGAAATAAGIQGLQTITAMAAKAQPGTGDSGINDQGGVGNQPYGPKTPEPRAKPLPKNVRGLEDVIDKTALEALKARGGGASNTNVLRSDMKSWTVRDIGEAASGGDRDASAWLKMIKQAGSQGKGGK